MYISSTIADRIKLASKKRGVTVKQMLLDVGLGPSTMTNFKTSFPKTDTLARIADYLDVSVDYLLGREQKNTVPEIGNGVTAHERELLAAYRARPDMQPAVDRLLGIEESSASEKEA